MLNKPQTYIQSKLYTGCFMGYCNKNSSRELKFTSPIAFLDGRKDTEIKLDNLKMLQVLRALIVPLEEQISALKESVHFRKITK